MKIIYRILKYSFRYRLQWTIGMLSVLFSVAVTLITPRLIGAGIDRIKNGIANHDTDVTILLILGSLILVLSAFRGLFGYLRSYLSEWISQKVAYNLRNEVHAQYQKLSFSFHDKQQTGQLMSRATVDVEYMRGFVGFGFLRMAEMIIQLALTLVLAFILDWKLTLMILPFLPIALWRQITISVQLRKVWDKAQLHMGELGSHLQENLTGVKIVKAFAREPFESDKFHAKSRQLWDDNLASARLQAANAPMLSFILASVVGVILLFGGREVIKGNLTAGELAAFILYINQINGPLRITGFLLNTFSRAVSAGQRIFEILDAMPAVTEKADAKDFKAVKGRVEFDNVSFGYDKLSSVLSNVSFVAEPGQIVALLGGTGSGKSTIVNLIPRFYDVTSGRVMIDGHDVRDMKLDSLRKAIGTVQQDVFLFSASIKENIAYGRTDATDEEIIAAAKAARLHDFIVSQPDGYNTPVGERGITLSGGQKQRLAIARTIVTDPRVLILDDSTSSVDTETEYLIRQALNEVIKGRTTFVIAQRLTTVKNADMILVLNDGRIVERGKHEDLLKNDGIYKGIYDLQLKPQEKALAELAAAGSTHPNGAVGVRTEGNGSSFGDGNGFSTGNRSGEKPGQRGRRDA